MELTLTESSLKILEPLAVVTGFLYIIQTIRLKRNCWLFGGISCFMYILLFWNWKLYIDGLLNVYYVVMAVVGWFSWKKQETDFQVTTLPMKNLVLYFFVTLGSGLALALLLKTYTDAASPFLDALVGIFAVTATWLSTQKKIDNWYFWLVSNSVALALYLWKGLPLTALLMLAYLTLTAIGYWAWRKKAAHA